MAGQRPDQRETIAVNAQSRSSIGVTGWAVDEAAGRPAGGVYLEVDGERYPAFHGKRREELAEGIGDPAYEFSGFEGSIPVSELAPGTHEVSVLVVTSDRERYYRPGGGVLLRVE